MIVNAAGPTTVSPMPPVFSSGKLKAKIEYGKLPLWVTQALRRAIDEGRLGLDAKLGPGEQRAGHIAHLVESWKLGYAPFDHLGSATIDGERCLTVEPWKIHMKAIERFASIFKATYEISERGCGQHAAGSWLIVFRPKPLVP